MSIKYLQQETSDNSLTGRFARGAFWSLVGTVGARLSAFIVAVIVARFLGQVGFGELAMLQSTVGMLGTFVGLGIGMTATKYVAELRIKDPERTGRIIALTYLVSWTAGGVVAMFCLLAAPWLAAKTLSAPHLVPELRLSSLLVLISAGFGPQGAILAGFQAFRSLARINCYQGLLSLPINIVLVLVAGLRGVIIAMIVVTALGAILSFFSLQREYFHSKIHPNLKRAWQEKAILWRFSLPAFLASSIQAPVTWVAYAILARQPNGYNELGLFNAALQFNMLVTALNTISGSVSVPLLAEVYGQDHRERFALSFNSNLRLNWGLCIIFGSLAIILSPWLIRFFGADYHKALPILKMNIAFVIANVATSIAGQAFYSSGKMWFAPLATLIWALGLLPCAIFAVPLHGAIGLSVSMLIAYCLVFIVQLIFIVYLFGSSLAKDIYIFLLFYLIVILHVFVTQSTSSHIISISIYGALFIIGCYLLKKNNDILKKIFLYIRPLKPVGG